MDYSVPTLFVVSGLNGAGKSTHIKRLLPQELEGFTPFDRDKIRTGIEEKLFHTSAGQNEEHKKQAQVAMEEVLQSEMAKAILLKQHFVLETPLSHPDYWRYIDFFTRNGYCRILNSF